MRGGGFLSWDFVFFFCFGGKKRETVEEIERVCILFVKCGDLGSRESVWPLA